jgi:hypothetical protein
MQVYDSMNRLVGGIKHRGQRIRFRLTTGAANVLLRIVDSLLKNYGSRHARISSYYLSRGRHRMARSYSEIAVSLSPGTPETVSASLDLARLESAPDFVPDSTFSDIRVFCCFVGYPRSGHSLLGALLDAHPNIVIAHELNAPAHMDMNIQRQDLFRIIVENARIFGRGGRGWTGYDYAVPGAWQGRFERIQVIGDKKGGKASARLRRDPALLDRLSEWVELPLRVIHLFRNPWDNIATMTKFISLDGPAAIESSTGLYFKFAESVRRLKERGVNGEFLDIAHESLIAEPGGTLENICEFLDVEKIPAHLTSCADIVFRSPHESRSSVDWTARQKDEVATRAQSYPWLRDYRFED